MANRLRGTGTNHASSLLVGQQIIHGYEAAAARATSTARQSSSLLQPPPPPFTNTAKLPIETVKRLIAAVAHRPNLWIRNNNGQKRCDLTQLWYEVSQEVQIPADVCRTKWGHLRDNFRKVFIRNTLSDETPTTWRFYSDMRFMEKAVAENIMRQNRFKDQSRCWPELQQQELLYASAAKSNNIPPNFDIQDGGGFQRDDSQFNFSDVSAFFTETPPHKRIKLEHQARESESSVEKRLKADKQMGGGFTTTMMSDDYTQPDPDDDDEFDEDTATEENEHLDNNTAGSNQNQAQGDIFTIEVFDDDDDDEGEVADEGEKLLQQAQQVKLDKSESLPSSSVSGKREERTPTFKTIKLDSSTNTEHSGSLLAAEQDSDRLFLLSLLPYMQKVDEQRKLFVRQKLQNVLIDEFG